MITATATSSSLARRRTTTSGNGGSESVENVCDGYTGRLALTALEWTSAEKEEITSDKLKDLGYYI